LLNREKYKKSLIKIQNIKILLSLSKYKNSLILIKIQKFSYSYQNTKILLSKIDKKVVIKKWDPKGSHFFLPRFLPRFIQKIEQIQKKKYKRLVIPYHPEGVVILKGGV